MERASSTHGTDEIRTILFPGKSEWKSSLGKDIPRREDNIRLDLRKIGLEVYVTQERNK